MARSLSVFVLEDDAVLRTSIVDSLYELGYETVEACSSNAEALRQLGRREAHVDVGILDLNLRGETCHSTLVEFDRHGWPVILMSGAYPCNVPTSWGERLCLKKPFGASALEEALRRAMPRPHRLDAISVTHSRLA